VKRRRSPRWALLVAALAALALSGCGLAEYEKKMEEAEARLKRFDAENNLLGDPLALPTGDAAPSADLFLRPPKGVAKNPDDPRQAPLHYAAKDAVCTDLYLWFGAKDDDQNKLKQRIEAWLGPASGGWQSYAVQPTNGRPAITFDSAQFAPANAPPFRVYMHATSNGTPIAVVFKLAQPSPPTTDEVLKMSLETYTDSYAGPVRAEWVKWRGH
jgi:hypothetical protein